MTVSSSATAGLTGPAPLNVDTGLESAGSGVEGIDQEDFSTHIPVASFEQFNQSVSEGLTTPNGFSSALNGTGNDVGGVRGQIAAYAKKFLGDMYKWGGSSPSTSFDCSGFVQYVTGKFGAHLPRVSYQQVNSGKHIGLDQLLPGDIVGWDNSTRNKGADHVALYIGNGQIMEFYASGKPSRIRKLGHNEGAIGVRVNYGK